MTVYIELVFLQNFLVDLAILLVICGFFKIKPKPWRVVLASTLGGVFAVLLPFANIKFVFEILIKLAIGIVLTCTAFETKNFKLLCAYFCSLLAFTFGLGGAVFGLLCEFKLNNFKTNIPNFIITATICGVLMFCLVFIKLGKFVAKRLKTQQFSYNAKICVGDKQFKTKCFYDSGNRLIDQKTGKPVNIMSLNLLKKICTLDDIQKIMCGNIENLNLLEPDYINFSTINSADDCIFAFTVNSFDLSIDGKTKHFENVRFGVIFKEFTCKDSFEVLLNYSVL